MSDPISNSSGPSRDRNAETSRSAVDAINAQLPACVKTLNGRVFEFSGSAQRLSMSFDITRAFCHSGDIVQGGIVTAMLDAAMSHAVIGVMGESIRSPATLEIKVSFLRPARAGRLVAHGQILRAGRSTCFLEGDLESEDGDLLARATSTARVIPLAPHKGQGQ